MNDIDSAPPRRRKAILVISKDEKKRLEYEPGGSEILQNEQLYLLVPSEADSSAIAEHLDRKQLLNRGNLLIQNPYDSSDYESIDEAPIAFAILKFENFITLCGKLGAREVKIERLEVENSKGQTEFTGNVDSPLAGIQAQGAKKTLEKIRNEFSISATFPGENPDFDEAECFLRKRLLADRSLQPLIDQRRPPNQIKAKEIILNLTKESNSNLGIIAGLKVPLQAPQYVSLEGKLNRIKEKFYELKIKFSVNF
ncbi:hypothetical protein ACE1CI_21090 [Aerosakkonemataceae cyanobacterium BLCC-F50]|uniref:Uncharacterized protein n=1 Tax=Floridaenema flaviceps BLCC-F50 TaxID=3153642 RepID=A0ABV4XVF8_9CYAN